MSDNVVQFAVLRDRQKTKKVKTQKVKSDSFNFSEEVEKDINNLMSALNLTREESFAVAKDFYRKYPMLMEFIREPNNLLEK